MPEINTVTQRPARILVEAGTSPTNMIAELVQLIFLPHGAHGVEMHINLAS